MKIMLHKNATTTPRIRDEIRNSDEPNLVLARRNNITVATVRKWKGREANRYLRAFSQDHPAGVLSGDAPKKGL